MMGIVALAKGTLVSPAIECNTKKLFQLPPPFPLSHQLLIIEYQELGEFS